MSFSSVSKGPRSVPRHGGERAAPAEPHPQRLGLQRFRSRGRPAGHRRRTVTPAEATSGMPPWPWPSAAAVQTCLVLVILTACGGGAGDTVAVSPTSPTQPASGSGPEAPPDPSPPPLPPPDPTPPPIDPTPVAPAEEVCRDWEELGEGGYVYVNNVWNKGSIVDYEQCVMRRVVDGENQYGWRWRWPSQSPAVAAAAQSLPSRFSSPIGQHHTPNHEVRAFPEVRYGHHPHSVPTTPDLPVQISAIRQLRVDYEAYMAADGDYNLAFDLWITNDNPPTPEGTTHEVMIWVDRTDWAPSGPEHHVAEVEIDGSEFGPLCPGKPKMAVHRVRQIHGSVQRHAPP